MISTYKQEFLRKDGSAVSLLRVTFVAFIGS